MLPELHYFYAIYRRNQHHTLNKIALAKKRIVYFYSVKKEEKRTLSMIERYL
ncbi:hypothetical protein SAMN02745975_02976 [Geosporobacter subterraneus DSM 17957]|uniref:Uncharacterized protein n=1 Tax=Geosporobacter subterraneus DSM 17957 TaxID=1121919 RepID=A0A1M6MGS5_9FIRM|nr:hypothetical protein SAMN02745975_02976 [Geosporobacter subterraneus DSM 17957]